MLLAASHLLLATNDVPRITAFFAEAFEIRPHFENEMFSEFVLASRFRIAFFRPVGASARSLRADDSRGAAAVGLTVTGVERLYDRLVSMTNQGLTLSGPPKEHPWGEKSFLLTDMDGNRWEITESPAADGMLVNR